MDTVSNILKNYPPCGQQEEQDQHQMLSCLSLFDNLLTRENKLAHFTSSAFVINKEQTKTLFIHHKIYQTWCWVGGHADGQSDLLKVAIKEVQEETGIQKFETFSTDIVTLDILPVSGHFKNGQWVSAHLHFNVAYVLIADEKDKLIQNQVETNGIAWIPFEEIARKSGEPAIVPIYKKIITKIKKETE